LKKAVAVMVLVITALVFAVPLLIRLEFQQGLLFGEESYETILLAQKASNPYYALVSVLGQQIGTEVAAELLPIIFGALSAILFFVIVLKLESDFSLAIASVLIFATIPATMYVFSASVPESLALFIVFLAFYLSLFRHWLLKTASLAATFALLAFGFFPFLLALILLVSSFMKDRNKQLVFFGLLFIAAIASWIYGIVSPEIAFNGFLSSVVADFGGLYGVGLFHLILALAGIAILWQHRLTARPMYFSAIFVIGAFGLFGSRLILFSVFIFAFFSAVAIKWLVSFKWESGLIKSLTILVIIFGLMFSTASYLQRIATMEPTPQLVSGLDWLKQQPSGIVLSDPSNTFWIEYFARMPALAKPGVNNAKIAALFASRKLEFTNQSLYSYGVKYIWIDPSMKEGKVWKKPQQGMLFLFRSNVTFRKLDERLGIETWEYIGGN
jgi:hypothetical protein